MTNETKQWNDVERWLAARLSMESCGDFAQNIVRDADAQGFSREQLGAAYTSLKAETSENNCWTLDTAKRAYWRNYALLNAPKTAPAVEAPVAVQLARAPAPTKPAPPVTATASVIAPSATASPTAKESMNAIQQRHATTTTTTTKRPAPWTASEIFASRRGQVAIARGDLSAATESSQAMRRPWTHAEVYAFRQRCVADARAAGQTGGAIAQRPPARESASDVFARRRRAAGHAD